MNMKVESELLTVLIMPEECEVDGFKLYTKVTCMDEGMLGDDVLVGYRFKRENPYEYGDMEDD